MKFQLFAAAVGLLLAAACSTPRAATQSTDVAAGVDVAFSLEVLSAKDATASKDEVSATDAAAADAAPDTLLDAAPDAAPDTAADLAADTGLEPLDVAQDDAPAADVPLTPVQTGCADATREGFAELKLFPTIAACGGAWDQAGIFNMPVKCNREAGNTGKNAPGIGCTVSDLCAEGWHVCYGKDDVVHRNADGCLGVLNGVPSSNGKLNPVFFTSQMSSTGSFECASSKDATNDLFGCGNLGCNFTDNATVKAMCAPLSMSSHDQCKGLRNDLAGGDWCNHLGKYPGLPNSWNCGSDTTKEALNVKKSNPDQQGGVLCCMN